MKRGPEQIPDVSLSSYPYHAHEYSERLRLKTHQEMVNARQCHAYESLEYHYCGRREGRLFPLAPESSRPEPTLPNPNVRLAGQGVWWLRPERVLAWLRIVLRIA